MGAEVARTETSSFSTSGGLRKPSGHLPGEPGVWILIGGDMLVFSLFFLTFLTYRNASVALYEASQAKLHLSLGLSNTVLLLTSSWSVAQAVRAARVGRSKAAVGFFGIAFLCGLGFCVVKLVEYHEKLVAGIDMGANEFFMFYFMLTGIHLLHVIVGLGVLLVLRTKISRQQELYHGDITLIESGATFWHLVDILWILLFALLYLAR
jgi:nitric oxide reductase NorE protein